MTATADAVNNIRDALALKQLAVVVGTGVTAGATDMAPTSTWRGLIEHGIERCETLGTRDRAWAERAIADANSQYDLDLIVAAEKATDGLGGRLGPEYRRWLAEAAGELRATDTTVLDALVALADEGALICTTNYDDLLADALGWDVVTWRDPVRLQRVLRGTEQAVVHIHGHWKDPESVVFGASSYADVLRDSGAAMFLKVTVYARTLLFVGFGAGLDDPNFSGLRRWMRSDLSLSDFQHYRLVREADLVSAHHDPDERIRVVSYGTQFDDLAPFLAALRSGVPARGVRTVEASPGGGAAAEPEAGALPLPLPPRAPTPEQLQELVETAGALARMEAIARDPDEGAAVTAAHGGDRLDEYRRFVFLFADELAQVAQMADRHAELDAPAVEHALAWARRLFEIGQASR